MIKNSQITSRRAPGWQRQTSNRRRTECTLPVCHSAFQRAPCRADSALLAVNTTEQVAFGASGTRGVTNHKRCVPKTTRPGNRKPWLQSAPSPPTGVSKACGLTSQSLSSFTCKMDLCLKEAENITSVINSSHYDSEMYCHKVCR